MLEVESLCERLNLLNKGNVIYQVKLMVFFYACLRLNNFCHSFIAHCELEMSNIVRYAYSIFEYEKLHSNSNYDLNMSMLLIIYIRTVRHSVLPFFHRVHCQKGFLPLGCYRDIKKVIYHHAKGTEK